MKRLKIRIETCMEDCILNTSMQRKKMRMSFSHTCPNDRWPFSRSEDAHTTQRQQKWRHPNLGQGPSQAFLRMSLNVAEKAEGQMKLFFRNPPQAAKMGIERKKRYFATSRKSETNKEVFRCWHSKRYNSSSKAGENLTSALACEIFGLARSVRRPSLWMDDRTMAEVRYKAASERIF